MFKAHQLYGELDAAVSDKIIYILRDPRDIIVSGAGFFYPHKFIFKEGTPQYTVRSFYLLRNL